VYLAGDEEHAGMNQFPCLIRTSAAGGEARYALGDPLVDSYLAFVAGRSRPNTLRAVAHDLKTFFSVIDKDPVEVVAADIFGFVAAQRGDRTVIRITDGESGLSARTIARRLSSISGLYVYLVARGDTTVQINPVPRGLSTRRRGGRRRQVPLVRVPRTLPKILSPAEVTALLGALRTHRDRAMVYAMVLGGLRRCEVLGLTLGDIQVPERSLFIAVTPRRSGDRTTLRTVAYRRLRARAHFGECMLRSREVTCPSCGKGQLGSGHACDPDHVAFGVTEVPDHKVTAWVLLGAEEAGATETLRLAEGGFDVGDADVEDRVTRVSGAAAHATTDPGPIVRRVAVHEPIIPCFRHDLRDRPARVELPLEEVAVEASQPLRVCPDDLEVHHWLAHDLVLLARTGQATGCIARRYDSTPPPNSSASGDPYRPACPTGVPYRRERDP
jgi:hypothetical protein